MPDTADRREKTVIEQVAALVAQRLEPDQQEIGRRFARQFLADVPPDDLMSRSPEELCGATLSLWRLGQERQPGTPKIRVCSPRQEEDGWTCNHTVIQIVNDDMPFLVDSVTAEIGRRDLSLHIVIHPILRVERDAGGRLMALHEPSAAASSALVESYMHLEIDRRTSPEIHRQLETALAEVLTDVRLSVEDWPAMRQRMSEAIIEVESRRQPGSREDRQETSAFLRWLDDHHYTYLGYRTYRFEGAGDDAGLGVVPGRGLGLLRDDGFLVFDGLRNLSRSGDEARAFVRSPELLLITKSSQRSRVHRVGRFDAIGVKQFDASGQVTGFHLFIGLLTSSAYAKSAHEIPFLRRRVREVLGRVGFDPISHNGKALTHILDTYPRDELFQMSVDELLETGLAILNLQDRRRIALLIRRDPFGRFITCTVYAPRDRVDTALRLRFRAILERELKGKLLSFNISLEDSPLGRIQFTIEAGPETPASLDVRAIEKQLIEAARVWGDRLLESLIDARGEEAGLELSKRYGEAFPAGFRERVEPAEAVRDIGHLEEVAGDGALALDLSSSAQPDRLRLKLYHADAPVPLSDMLPVLERLGLRVISELPHAVHVQGREQPIWIHDLDITLRSKAAVEFQSVEKSFEDAFQRIWRGEMESDGLNALVLEAGLAWREVVLLRAYTKFLRQARFAFSQEVIEETFVAYPHVARLLVRLFRALHDPTPRPQGATEAAGLIVELDHALDKVENLDEERICRTFLDLVRATLRTNFFQSAADGQPKSYLSLKLDSQALTLLPAPRPLVEVFVYSPRTEAVHLRGGRIARGGIRWSDRREDFRTEILGLMKAQMVKNAVIVPVGAKGGFVLKKPPTEGGRAALQTEGIECYKILMRGLLDITDNLVEGQVVPPPQVVRRDGDDPYLVVAADKGTATFSDIANGVSQEYGFWLDDAFASGGSSGYDHKAMGITARGAWESVKRHFREIGIDTQSQPFTVVGVGDMSGDVFGNGMLQSRFIKLIGAFDHRHIFCDPDPDPAASFTERERLFNLPGSSWASYDAKLLSEGGAIFERGAKLLRPSPQIRQAFGIAKETLTPAELMSAMLKAPVDLLWFGGIGTYVKSVRESHADASDKANDALRVNGGELRAKVLGEGANLGVTQQGRVDFARRGGRINTDFIDNSAGVDTSDHEVNIKILMRDVATSRGMTIEQRDKLLAEMTDEVAALVLRDNYQQTQALSVVQRRGVAQLESQARFIRNLEKAGQLDRVLEGLPDEEGLAERTRERQGLTRPELSVLLARSKMVLYESLLSSGLPDEARMEDDLFAYFPTPLRESYQAEIERHRLRREIVATAMANSLVNRLGPTFVSDVAAKSGLEPSDVARAYAIGREVFDLRAFWADIEALDGKADAALQLDLLGETVRLLERAVSWFQQYGGQPLDLESESAIYAPEVKRLADRLDLVLTEGDEAVRQARISTLLGQGAPETVARRAASLLYLGPALDIIRIARSRAVQAPLAAEVYYAVGERFGMEWLRRQAAGLSGGSYWQNEAIEAIGEDLDALQAGIAAGILESAGNRGGRDAVAAWVELHAQMVGRIDVLLAEIHAAPATDLAMIGLATRRLRSLARG